MRKHMETFMLLRATNWRLSFLYRLLRFQNKNLWYIFKVLFAQKQGLAQPYFLLFVCYFLFYITFRRKLLKIDQISNSE